MIVSYEDLSFLFCFNASEGEKVLWIEAIRLSEYFKQFLELYGE